MDISKLTLGLYQTNTYIVSNGGHCVVIDPGYEPETIGEYANSRNLTVDAILLTHGHFDHVGAVKELVLKWECPVYLHEGELSMPPMMTAGQLYCTHFYDEGDIVEAAGISFHVLHTPGHTPGSVCLLTENAMFSGDTLFAGSCGRTDLPCGSSADMKKSLARLAGLSLDCTVYPGHGGSTSLAEERRYNPYLK